MSASQAAYPWHRSLLAGLVRRLSDDTLHHALMIEGPDGTGLRALVDLLAAAVLCDELGADGACGACRSCQLVRAGTHPDLMLIEPEEAGKQIRIDRIRELSGFVGRTASVSQRKAVVIDPADAMNAFSANSLLKSLEEPTPGTHLLLATRSAGRLLPTIRSRCEQLRLPMPEASQARGWLAGQVDASQVDMLLDAASGRPLAALELAGQGGLDLLTSIAGAFELCARPSTIIPPVVAAFGDHDLREVLAVMSLVLLDWQRGLLTDERADWRLSCNHDIYQRMEGLVSREHLAQTLAAVQRAMRDAASTANPNRVLLLEAILVEWQAGCSGKNRR